MYGKLRRTIDVYLNGNTSISHTFGKDISYKIIAEIHKTSFDGGKGYVLLNENGNVISVATSLVTLDIDDIPVIKL